MDPIPRERMGNATSLFNLMRNLGGSLGIAAATTVIARVTQRNFSVLGEHLNVFDPQTRSTLAAMQQRFMASGMDPDDGIEGRVRGRWGASSTRRRRCCRTCYVFRAFGLIFIVAVPLLFLLKRPSSSRAPAAAH